MLLLEFLCLFFQTLCEAGAEVEHPVFVLVFLGAVFFGDVFQKICVAHGFVSFVVVFLF